MLLKVCVIQLKEISVVSKILIERSVNHWIDKEQNLAKNSFKTHPYLAQIDNMLSASLVKYLSFLCFFHLSLPRLSEFSKEHVKMVDNQNQKKILNMDFRPTKKPVYSEGEVDEILLNYYD